MRKITLFLTMIIFLITSMVVILGGCSSGKVTVADVVATSTPTATVTPTLTPTPVPTPTATPVPAILLTPLKAYDPPNKAFTIKIPEGWDAFEDGGGIRFQDASDPYVSLTAFYFPLPRDTEGKAFLQEEANRALSRARLNNPNTLQVLRNDISDDGHLRLEAIGQFFEDQPLQHLLAETWVENNVLLGLNLMTPEDKWDAISPIWPKLRQSYEIVQPDPGAVTGLAYVHPGGLFTMTVPLFWGIISEDYDGVLLGDMQGLAQFGVSVEEMDHYPTPKELDGALLSLLGDTPQAEGYLELKKIMDKPNLRMIQFEVPSGEDGIYRTEISVRSDRNLLIATTFSAPPHDWDYFAPDYKLLLESIETRGNAAPDAETQKKNPLAGIEVGVPMYYLDRSGRLQVSAPIRNFRSHSITNVTATINLYDEEGHFLAAESWRMLQKVVGSGRTTYLYRELPPETTDLSKVARVKIQLIAAKDTKAKPYPSWSYEGGAADLSGKGDVVVTASLSNKGSKSQKYIFVAVLLYDEEGNLVFVKTERQRLRAITPPGVEADVKVIIRGPFEGLVSFDVVGEEPLLD